MQFFNCKSCFYEMFNFHFLPTLDSREQTISLFKTIAIQLSCFGNLSKEKRNDEKKRFCKNNLKNLCNLKRKKPIQTSTSFIFTNVSVASYSRQNTHKILVYLKKIENFQQGDR